MPRASAIHAIVEAVPITAHVPLVVERRPSILSISERSVCPARYFPQNLRQSVHAPSRSPSWRPVIIGPPTSWIAGRPADTAPVNCEGTVLAQPPITTPESIGGDGHDSSEAI